MWYFNLVMSFHSHQIIEYLVQLPAIGTIMTEVRKLKLFATLKFDPRYLKQEKTGGSWNGSKTVQIIILQEYKSVLHGYSQKKNDKTLLHITNAKNGLIVCMLGVGQLKIDNIPLPQNTSNVSMKNWCVLIVFQYKSS